MSLGPSLLLSGLSPSELVDLRELMNSFSSFTGIDLQLERHPEKAMKLQVFANGRKEFESSVTPTNGLIKCLVDLTV